MAPTYISDVDLDWRDTEDELLEVLLDTADHDAGDFFGIRVERASPPADRLGGSCRFRVSTLLAGREFETFLLDVGFGASPTRGIDWLTTPEATARAVAPRTSWTSC